MKPTPAQLELIENQLGRTPRGLSGIAYATQAGVPVILQMQSLVDDKPFPTLYWLCSRDLYQWIAEIETAGWIKTIEAELQTDESLRETYMAQQQAYCRTRREAMSPQIRQRITELGFDELFDRYGIGGIAQWDKVRCLHMNYAHHLVGENVIGQRMDEAFGLKQRLEEIRR